MKVFYLPIFLLALSCGAPKEEAAKAGTTKETTNKVTEEAET